LVPFLRSKVSGARRVFEVRSAVTALTLDVPLSHFDPFSLVLLNAPEHLRKRCGFCFEESYCFFVVIDGRRVSRVQNGSPGVLIKGAEQN
jgi:hypothetical protein